jgi:hypothetical protein
MPVMAPHSRSGREWILAAGYTSAQSRFVLCSCSPTAPDRFAGLWDDAWATAARRPRRSAATPQAWSTNPTTAAGGFVRSGQARRASSQPWASRHRATWAAASNQRWRRSSPGAGWPSQAVHIGRWSAWRRSSSWVAWRALASSRASSSWSARWERWSGVSRWRVGSGPRGCAAASMPWRARHVAIVSRRSSLTCCFRRSSAHGDVRSAGTRKASWSVMWVWTLRAQSPSSPAVAGAGERPM